jgi:hypothetical protein
MDEDRDRGDEEDDAQHDGGVALEELHQIMADECDSDLEHDDDDERDPGGHTRERGERQGTAHGVDREPSEARHDRVDRRRQDVASQAEGGAAEHQLGESLARPPGGEHALGESTERVADDDREERVPEVEAEVGDGDDAHEDGREFEVRARPGGEKRPRRPVPLLGRDGLDAPGFDRGGAPLRAEGCGHS